MIFISNRIFKKSGPFAYPRVGGPDVAGREVDAPVHAHAGAAAAAHGHAARAGAVADDLHGGEVGRLAEGERAGLEGHEEVPVVLLLPICVGRGPLACNVKLTKD